MQWELRIETGKIGGKPIEVYYVGTKGKPYGYATFTIESAARAYLLERQDLLRSEFSPVQNM